MFSSKHETMVFVVAMVMAKPIPIVEKQLHPVKDGAKHQLFKN